MANAQIQIDFLENGKGGHYLLHRGYKFSIRTRRGDRTYWRCVDRQCRAKFTTINNIPVTFDQNHNHDSDYTGLAAAAFINTVRKRCREEVIPIPSIYDDELGKLRDSECDDTVVEMIKRIPTFENCRQSLYNNRQKLLPKLPLTQGDIDLDGDWKMTSAGERLLLCDDTDNRGHRILIFATDDNLRRLCASQVIFGDGTFYSCPGLFFQLFSLHGSIEDSVFPFVFALLPNKTEQTYNRFFTLLRDAVRQRNLDLIPETVLLDFETATRNAVNTVFPLTVVRGCYFHYTQSIWRKTQTLGLAVRYREDDNLRMFVRRAAVLPLVPADRVEDVWFSALEDNVDISPEVTRFADYVTETWVEGLPHSLWNHFDSEGPRTTNVVEGWHSKINKICRHAHPNIYATVSLLKNVQATNEARIIQLVAGGKQRPRKRKYRQLDERLHRVKERLVNGQMDIMEYADAASHLLHLE